MSCWRRRQSRIPFRLAPWRDNLLEQSLCGNTFVIGVRRKMLHVHPCPSFPLFLTHSNGSPRAGVIASPPAEQGGEAISEMRLLRRWVQRTFTPYPETHCHCERPAGREAISMQARDCFVGPLRGLLAMTGQKVSVVWHIAPSDMNSRMTDVTGSSCLRPARNRIASATR